MKKTFFGGKWQQIKTVNDVTDYLNEFKIVLIRQRTTSLVCFEPKRSSLSRETRTTSFFCFDLKRSSLWRETHLAKNVAGPRAYMRMFISKIKAPRNKNSA
jgi:hypothetical protein